MKTIVYKTPEIKFYTYIKDWLPYISDDIGNYNFALSEVETNCDHEILNKWKSSKEKIEYWIPGKELKKLSENDEMQFIWGVFSALSVNVKIDGLTVNSEFYIDGNNKITNDDKDKFIKEAEFEIIAFDSSFFVVQSDIILIHEKIKRKYKNAHDIKDEDRLWF